MARRKKRIQSLLCALAVLLVLLLPAAGAAGTPTIYLMAENDKMLNLPLDAMPAWIGGTLYVPYLAFDRTVTDVNLGLSYGQERAEGVYRFTLYSLRGTLVFDLNAGTCMDQLNGVSMDMRAVVRNGRVFLPLQGVCAFFGLNYTYTPTQYGTLIRITNGQEWLSTQDFVSNASDGAMRTRYNEYLRQLEAASQAQESPSPSPSQGGSDPEGTGLPVYLAFQCAGGGELEAVLDSLESRGIRALFLFRQSALAGSAEQLRRLVGTGHAVGLSVPGGSAEEARAALEGWRASWTAWVTGARGPCSSSGGRPWPIPPTSCGGWWAPAMPWACRCPEPPWRRSGRSWRRAAPCWKPWPTCAPTPSIWKTPPPAWPPPWRRRGGCAGPPTWTPGATAAAPAPRPPPCSGIWTGAAPPPGCCWMAAPRARRC